MELLIWRPTADVGLGRRSPPRELFSYVLIIVPVSCVGRGLGVMLELTLTSLGPGPTWAEAHLAQASLGPGPLGFRPHVAHRAQIHA